MKNGKITADATYWIGNIYVYCECGNEEEFILPDSEPEDIYECPNCGAKATIRWWRDDSVGGELDCYDVKEEEEE